MTPKNIKTYFLLVLLTLTTTFLFAQAKYTLSGTIYDGETGETMIGASVITNTSPTIGTTCNAYGFYSLSLPEGDYTIEVSYIGYEPIRKTIKLTANIKMDFKFSTNGKMLDEIVVSAVKRNENIISHNVGVEKLSVKEISSIPVLFGEKDVVKILSLTPGVKTSGEGSGGMFVRGGNNAQNLVLLDEATVYNSSHLLGFFSTFNSDAIKDLTLYKGTAPAQYGGRISSVMDVKMNDGNNQKYRIGGGIGLISSKLNIEGPIVKDKGSFLLTGRRTYADLFLKLSSDDKINNNKLFFYDLNVKTNYKINDNNRVFLSGYFGRDVLSFNDKFGIDWGNATGTMRWNHIWNSKLFSNTSLIYSDYDYKVAIDNEENPFSLKSVINNWTLKQEFQYYLGKNTLTFGFSSQYHTITPGQLEFEKESDFNTNKLQDRYALENGLFISNKWKGSSKFSVAYGLRLSTFSTLGAGDFFSYDDAGAPIDTMSYGSNKIVKSYINLEPRLNLSYVFNEAASLKASYTRNTQNLHLIQNSNASTPTDLWIPSSANVAPEISDQVAFGYFRNLKENKYQLSTEIYYRSMQNQIDLKNGAEIQSNEHLEGELLYGIGRSYGLEVMFKKKYGKLNGWLAYTLSRTERLIDGINNGNWYAARQDATHDISVVGIYNLTKKWTLSATWVYNTGNAATFPSGKYEVDGNVQFYYTERNGYRMPDYHRLDIGATYTRKKSKNFESSWAFSLYNAYGQKNAYTIDFVEDPNDASKTIAEKTYLFTYMPSVSYNFKF